MPQVQKRLLLELFSGTGSIGTAFRARGWDVISLDLDPQANADIRKNVLEFDVSELQGREVDVVWASPPCVMFSIARHESTKDELEASDAMVKKSLLIARELGCPIFIENPATGKLKTRGILDHLRMHIVDYCKYSNWQYRKRTAIWTDTAWKPLRALCKYDCSGTVPGAKRHIAYAQQGPPGPLFTQRQLYRIPPELCNEIAAFCDAMRVQT